MLANILENIKSRKLFVFYFIFVCLGRYLFLIKLKFNVFFYYNSNAKFVLFKVSLIRNKFCQRFSFKGKKIWNKKYMIRNSYFFVSSQLNIDIKPFWQCSLISTIPKNILLYKNLILDEKKGGRAVFFDFLRSRTVLRDLTGKKVNFFLDRSLGKVVRRIFGSSAVDGKRFLESNASSIRGTLT